MSRVTLSVSGMNFLKACSNESGVSADGLPSGV